MHFQSLLDESGLTKAALGRILGVDAKTVSRWGREAPRYAIAYLELYIYCHRFREGLADVTGN
jgi:DNA-binding XRE family transcriptional regulator